MINERRNAMLQLNQPGHVGRDYLSSLEGAALHHPVPDYVLGNSAQEQERLKLQARILEKWTEHFFLSAGLERGMSVLDLGCGMGDVSLLAARLVGPAGSVTGIDRDEIIVAKARERTRDQRRGANIEFICRDFLDFHTNRKFDAVVGRYFLLYQPDPVAAILHASRQVRSEGIVVFHEMDFANPIRSDPDGTLFGRMCALIAETFRLAGCCGNLGLLLTGLFLDAGLPWPAIKAEVPVGGEPGSFIYTWIAATLRSLLPRIEQFGLASADELQLDTLVARMETEAVACQAQLIGPIQFGAWIRNP
jgi:ubiquinone/menaquinone biosynthesis C-methylase UbiE